MVKYKINKFMEISEAIGIVRSLVDIAKLEKYDNIIDDNDVKAMETLIKFAKEIIIKKKMNIHVGKY